MKRLSDKLNDQLTERYGLMITMDQMADLLNVSVNGLRTTMGKKDSPTSKLLSPAKTKVGRRSYFFANIVAESLADNNKNGPPVS